MSENLRHYTKALYGFDAMVRRVPADLWDAASPCEGWCARDLVTHSVGVAEAVATMASTGAAVMPRPPEAGDDVVALWDETLDKVLEAIDNPGVLDQVGAFWFGESTFDDVLGFAKWDPLLHTWDLGKAVGVVPHVSQAVAESSIAVLSPMADGLRAGGLMGPQVEVPADADALTRLLGLTGRTP